MEQNDQSRPTDDQSSTIWDLKDWERRLAPDIAQGSKENSGDSIDSDPGTRSVAHGSIPTYSDSESSLLLSVSREAMACEFEVLQNQHQYEQGTEAAVEALDLIQEVEGALSVYKPTSDFSRLNRAESQPTVVGIEALEVLSLGKFLHQVTSGTFDITAGTLSEAWGFSRRKGKLPTSKEIEESSSKVGSQHLQIDEENSRISLAQPGLQINPGGIGKGYALDLASQRLVSANVFDFMIHGGLSSIAARGSHRNADEPGWYVSLMHPLRPEQSLGRVRLMNKALATSGSGKQFFHFGGRRYSHIIDPRTGYPAEGTLSATVICTCAAIADALATAFFVMSLEEVGEFCKKRPYISAILVHQGSGKGLCIETFNCGEEIWSASSQ